MQRVLMVGWPLWYAKHISLPSPIAAAAERRFSTGREGEKGLSGFNYNWSVFSLNPNSQSKSHLHNLEFLS